jgi:hypothetical protein
MGKSLLNERMLAVELPPSSEAAFKQGDWTVRQAGAQLIPAHAYPEFARRRTLPLD